ncbi:MAG: 4-(cytidine 5'-diphospho)-2-C-methyl-D-erythritol kinase, partial [Bacteroidetes bacterium]|nr:4-(cytidine 5'-diphospho)-2-C-methyl-D-erythritol kinase [Bacteroidota bacterium]
FIENIPFFAYGKGDEFQKVKFSLKNFYIVIVKTQVHIDSATAYANITSSNHKYPVKEIVQLPVQKWKKYMLNDFEEYVFERYPEISDVKRELYKQEAVYVSLSGSGSAVYGIFRAPVNLRELFPDYFTWQGRSIF